VRRSRRHRSRHRFEADRGEAVRFLAVLLFAGLLGDCFFAGRFLAEFVLGALA
jgi:hypothetical protein